MLEIKSTWKNAEDDYGNPFQMLVLFMSIDNKVPFNFAFKASELKPENTLEMLIAAITELTHACYPELNDPLYRMKKELKELESRVDFVKRNIHEMEQAREECLR